MLGLVGESGSGKSITGFSIMGLVDPPGRIVGGAILYQGQRPGELSEREMRALRGNRIAMIFQDPMMTLNPVLRIDTQMIEAMQAHAKVSHAEARARARDALGRSAFPARTSAWRRIRTSSPAACASAWRSPSRCCTSPDLLIADEPTTALDVTIQAQILSEVQKLAATQAPR